MIADVGVLIDYLTLNVVLSYTRLLEASSCDVWSMNHGFGCIKHFNIWIFILFALNKDFTIKKRCIVMQVVNGMFHLCSGIAVAFNIRVYAKFNYFVCSQKLNSI